MYQSKGFHLLFGQSLDYRILHAPNPIFDRE